MGVTHCFLSVFYEPPLSNLSASTFSMKFYRLSENKGSTSHIHINCSVASQKAQFKPPLRYKNSSSSDCAPGLTPFKMGRDFSAKATNEAFQLEPMCFELS